MEPCDVDPITQAIWDEPLPEKIAAPCPFCGGGALGMSTVVHWVRCAECGAESEHTGTRSGALAKWNRRHADGPLYAAVRHVLARRQTDPDLAYHMCELTESWELLTKAEAAATGKPLDFVREYRRRDLQPEHRRRRAQIPELRERIEELESLRDALDEQVEDQLDQATSELFRVVPRDRKRIEIAGEYAEIIAPKNATFVRLRTPIGKEAERKLLDLLTKIEGPTVILDLSVDVVELQPIGDGSGR